jgi:hypothetical protein
LVEWIQVLQGKLNRLPSLWGIFTIFLGSHTNEHLSLDIYWDFVVTQEQFQLGHHLAFSHANSQYLVHCYLSSSDINLDLSFEQTQTFFIILSILKIDVFSRQ